MGYTVKDVQTLRERTGVGMKACKDALEAAGGDMEKAIDVLREKGLAAAAKKSGRIAAEGMVYAYADTARKVGVVVEVNSETDFVAKNAEFQTFVKAVAEVIAEQNPADVATLLTCPIEGFADVATALQAKILSIGENMTIRRFTRYEGDCVAYIHGGGRIGVLVKFDADATASGSAVLEECGKDVAMQIAALNAEFLDEASVPAEAVAREREVIMANIHNDPKTANKPEMVIQKMVDGRLAKFYKENCLMNQEFVKNGDLTVAQYVEGQAKAAGGAMKVVAYVRYEKGEGLQKREDDFAAEVASMMK